MGPSTRIIARLVAAAGIAGCGRHDAGGTLKLALDAPADTEFTSASGENRIRIEAILPSAWKAAEVTWNVARGVGDSWSPVKVAPGAKIEIAVASPGGASRLKGAHPTDAEARKARLAHQRIRYRIVATARDHGRQLTSDTLWVDQGARAAVRQEYFDIGLRHGAPPSDWFKPVSAAPRSSGNGDFDFAAVNPRFLERLGKLEETWKAAYNLPWQINSFYRNPAHNRFHVGGSGSGPVSNSWHQFGCAADLQTFPPLSRGSPRADTLKARQFWDALAEEARELDFEVEPRDKDPSRPGASYSGVAHVHIEMDCVP